MHLFSIHIWQVFIALLKCISSLNVSRVDKIGRQNLREFLSGDSVLQKVHRKTEQEKDEYDKNLDILMEISDRQMKDFILETWPLPHVIFNPGKQCALIIKLYSTCSFTKEL